jgi:hypothetical protein
MTREDIIRLARKASSEPDYDFPNAFALERFAALVAAAEREKLDLNAIHTCHDECQRPFCVLLRQEIAHEREQCAKLAESMQLEHPSGSAVYSNDVAAAIRARGQ